MYIILYSVINSFIGTFLFSLSNIFSLCFNVNLCSFTSFLPFVFSVAFNIVITCKHAINHFDNFAVHTARGKLRDSCAASAENLKHPAL